MMTVGSMFQRFPTTMEIAAGSGPLKHYQSGK